MSVKPILFSGPMVRAILDGGKSVTRRVIKPQPLAKLAYVMMGYHAGKWHYPDKRAAKSWGDEYLQPELTAADREKFWTPPCHGDDILWVRETWANAYLNGGPDGFIDAFAYRADGAITYQCDAHLKYSDSKVSDLSSSAVSGWRPSIHMPKKACRLFLCVTGVRVERLQDMTDDDAELEGCEAEWFDFSDDPSYPRIEVTATPRMAFAELWDSLRKPADRAKYGWDANPWVWRIEFKRVDKPDGWPDIKETET